MSSYANDTATPSSTAQPNPGMHGGTKAGASVGRKLEGIISRIHGTGEQIRGQFNLAIDKAMHDREGQARNQGIIDRGREEYNTGRIINNPEKRRYSRQNYPSTGGNAMAGAGTATGTGTAMGTGNGTTGMDTAMEARMPVETGRGMARTGTAMETGMPAETGRGMTRAEKAMETGMPSETGRGATRTGATMSSARAAMPQSPRQTEGSYGEPGPTNAAAYPEHSQVAGGPAVGGVNGSERKI